MTFYKSPCDACGQVAVLKFHIVTHAPNADVRVDVPRVVVAIHGAVAVVNAVVPIPAANERVKRKEERSRYGANGCPYMQ